MSRTIISECIGDQPSRFISLVCEKTVENAFSRRLIATEWRENIKAIAALIHGMPQILALPMNGEKDFIDRPRPAQADLSFFECLSIVSPKLLAPLPNGLIGHRDITFGP